MPAKRINRKARNRSGQLMSAGSRVFLPDYADQIRAIMMNGFDEDDISEIFDISRQQMGIWKAQYPQFKKAVEMGYTDADAAVLNALFQTATGYEHDEEKVMMWDGDIITHTVKKNYKPDVQAIKLWLTNRQRQNWSDRKETEVRGAADAPIGLRDETKMEVMSSILSLIQPKPDNAMIDGRTGEVED
jgi:hypothetical protein